MKTVLGFVNFIGVVPLEVAFAQIQAFLVAIALIIHFLLECLAQRVKHEGLS